MYHISRLCCAFWHHAGHIPSSWFCDRLPQLVTCGFSMVWPRPGNVDLSDPRASAIPPAAWLKTSILSPHGCTTTCTAQAQLRLYCGTAPKGTPQMQSATTHTGWWYTYPSEKYEFVSWDDDIPNIWKVIKIMFQTTNQTYQESRVWLSGTTKSEALPSLGLISRRWAAGMFQSHSWIASFLSISSRGKIRLSSLSILSQWLRYIYI